MADEIQSVTFTGGEPSLNLPLIQYFFDKADEKGKFPEFFWLATNGKANQEELAILALKAWAKSVEKDMCGVALSVDAYHEPVLNKFLSGLAFYDAGKEHPASGFEADKFIIRSGRAEENGLGKPPRNLDNDICIEGDEIDTLYVSAKGDCVFNCDLPYCTIDEEGIPLKDIFAKVERMVTKP